MKRLADRSRTVIWLAEDGALAAGACALDLLIFSDVLVDRVSHGLPTPVLVAYAASGYVALAFRRHVPAAVFAVLWTHSMITTQMPRYTATLGLAIALYTIAAYRGTVTSRVALLVTVLPAGLAVANEVNSAEQGEKVSTLLGSAMVLGFLNLTSWALGRWVRTSRLRTADLEHRRQVAAQQAVEAERARIARELHDIVAHSVTVMVLQAGGGQRVVKTDVARTEQAFAQIEELGKQAMAELRRMLRVLRAAEDEPEPDRTVGLQELDGLLQGFRQAGRGVLLEVAGESRPLDPSISLAAYRIVQEALTNVTKHAGLDAQSTVRIEWADRLILEIHDDGGTVKPPSEDTRQMSTGHGLLGLRERVAVAGGHFTAEPTIDGGFRVTATLPLAEHTAAGQA